ncbi:MAG: hypothetical protein JJW01_01905 [Alphaproteobacteria bacterium]|nr:hypothetical protein [Rickettsiales bacterium]
MLKLAKIVKCFLLNIGLKAKMVILFIWLFVLAIICLSNASLILITIPFIGVEVFFPKFIFVLLSYPVIKISYYLLSQKIISQEKHNESKKENEISDNKLQKNQKNNIL